MREYLVRITVDMRVTAHDADDAADRAHDDMIDLGHTVKYVEKGEVTCY